MRHSNFKEERKHASCHVAFCARTLLGMFFLTIWAAASVALAADGKPVDMTTSTRQPAAQTVSESVPAVGSDKQMPQATPPPAFLKKQAPQPDPYQKYNRKMFAFNQAVDHSVFKPLAKLYNKIIPRPLNHGLSKVFANVATVSTVANDLLQIKFYQALSDTWRLVVNTTAGVGGLFDVARHMQLPPHYESFNLTLAYWGWRSSNYLVLPFLGPNTMRGAAALPGEWVTSLYFYLPLNIYTILIFGVDMLDKRADLLRYESMVNRMILDPYVFYRNAYMQRQKYLIRQNERSDWEQPEPPAPAQISHTLAP